MSKELTPKHLEILARLAISDRPVKYTEFLPNLNPVLDLIESHHVNKIDESYELSIKGEEYFKNVLQYASECLEKKMNSN